MEGKTIFTKMTAKNMESIKKKVIQDSVGFINAVIGT